MQATLFGTPYLNLSTTLICLGPLEPPLKLIFSRNTFKTHNQAFVPAAVGVCVHMRARVCVCAHVFCKTLCAPT